MGKRQKLILKGGPTKLFIYKDGQATKTNYKGWSNEIIYF